MQLICFCVCEKFSYVSGTVEKQKQRSLRKYCSAKVAVTALLIKIHKSKSHLEICSKKRGKRKSAGRTFLLRQVRMHSARGQPGLCVSSLDSWPVVIKRLSGKDAMLSQQQQVQRQRRKRERFCVW